MCKYPLPQSLGFRGRSEVFENGPSDGATCVVVERGRAQVSALPPSLGQALVLG